MNGYAVHAAGERNRPSAFPVAPGSGGRLAPPAESEAEPQRVQGGALPGCGAEPRYFFPKPGMANLCSSFWRIHVAAETSTR